MKRQMPEGKVRLTIDIPREIRDALKMEASRQGVDPNQLITQWVEEKLAAFVKAAKKQEK